MIKKDILVVGESCRDIFVYCDCIRLCPDIPVPALTVRDQTDNPGMAKNVQRNILSLTKNCNIVTNNNWYNITKTRYMHRETNHMFLRVDTDHDIQRINVQQVPLDYKVIIISDYNKGFITEEDIEYITASHSCVFIDTKKVLGSWAEKAKFIKINNFEYNKSKPFLTDVLHSKIIHTKGGEGCIFQNKQYPVDRVEVCDTSGAGDTFISGLVYEYTRTSDIDAAIVFANKCASEVVRHKGVTALTNQL